MSTRGIQCCDYHLSQAELKCIPLTITCFKGSPRNVMFLWQHVNNDYHGFHVDVLSGSAFHFPEPSKRCFPALCEGVRGDCCLLGTTLGEGVYFFPRLKLTWMDTSATCSLGTQSRRSWGLKTVLTHSEGARVRKHS